MADNMKTKLINDALPMALEQRNPKGNLLGHTDRGSQYAPSNHRELLAKLRVKQSKSQRELLG